MKRSPIVLKLLAPLILYLSLGQTQARVIYDDYDEPEASCDQIVYETQPNVTYNHVIYNTQPAITTYYTPAPTVISSAIPIYAPVITYTPTLYTSVATTYYETDTVFDFNLELAVNSAAQKHAYAKNVNLDALSQYDYLTYNDIKNTIVSILRSTMYSTGRNYVYNYEIEAHVHTELDGFLDQHSPNAALSHIVSSIVSWFSGSEVNSHAFEQKVIDAAYEIIGLGPDTIPARVVSDFSDKIQSSLRRLRSRSCVTMDDIRQITREEMQPVIDKITFKSEICPICLGKYFSGQIVGITSCGHVYHRDCIYTWLNSYNNNQKNNTCPVCRASGVIVSKQETVPWVH